MKKLVTACAACLVAGLVSAQIASVNVVGYNTIQITKANTLIGVNLNGIGGALSIQDAFPYVAGMTQGTTPSVADSIQVRNSVGAYDTYYMSNGKNLANKDVTGLQGKWAVVGTYVPATATLAPGSAAWYLRKGTEAFALTVAGEVANDATSDRIIKPNANLIANPYAADLVLNTSLPYVVGMTKGNTPSVADSIQIQKADGMGYDTYYLSNGKNLANKDVTGLDGKWAVVGTYVPANSAAIQMGGSAWYLAKGASEFTLTIARPYTL